VLNLHVPPTNYVHAEVNPLKSLSEDTTDNNWLGIQPNVAPFPVSGATHCKPKPWYFWFPWPGK
jgi:hypothetical protein